MNIKGFHIHITAENEEQLKEILKEFAYVLTGLRHYSMKWQTQFGYKNKIQMQYWERKADRLIEMYKVESGDDIDQSDKN